ncbi:MAG: Rho-binding antiterminator [Porticoccaceae bacterium]|nr:Rho-binding antiterminator [Porticoccaceae bacterium]
MPCSVHDHLELACIAGALLRIELRDGGVIEVLPITTESRGDKTEWLRGKLPDSTPWEVRLDCIQAFEPTQHKALFAPVVLP